MSRPEIDKNGNIPCNCCDHNGKRKNMYTKEKRVCEFCNGTHMRKAPSNYMSQSQVDEQEREFLKYEECFE